jgi:hypothetical protein
VAGSPSTAAAIYRSIMATRFGVEHDGRRVEIEPEGTWTGDVVRLYVDDEQVAEAKKYGSPVVVAADGLEITAHMAWYGGAVRSAELVANGGVAKGVGRVLATLLVIGLGINLLPELHIDLDLGLPSIPFPSIDIQIPEPPGWVQAILESAKYWGPILAGIVIAVREWRKRRHPRDEHVTQRQLSAESEPR